tara:strand:- start:134 stop:301 length:168 start_codon:yes stop_codon:yes gene_type:complete
MKKDDLSIIFQLIASISWMVSTFFYGLSGVGDYLQLLASSAWTVSNIISYLKRQI